MSCSCPLLGCASSCAKGSLNVTRIIRTLASWRSRRLLTDIAGVLGPRDRVFDGVGHLGAALHRLGHLVGRGRRVVRLLELVRQLDLLHVVLRVVQIVLRLLFEDITHALAARLVNVGAWDILFLIGSGADHAALALRVAVKAEDFLLESFVFVGRWRWDSPL